MRETARKSGQPLEALAPGDNVGGLAGGGRSPLRTFLHGNSLLTRKIAGNSRLPLPVEKRRTRAPATSTGVVAPQQPRTEQGIGEAHNREFRVRNRDPVEAWTSCPLHPPVLNARDKLPARSASMSGLFIAAGGRRISITRTGGRPMSRPSSIISPTGDLPRPI